MFLLISYEVKTLSATVVHLVLAIRNSVDCKLYNLEVRKHVTWIGFVYFLSYIDKILRIVKNNLSLGRFIFRNIMWFTMLNISLDLKFCVSMEEAKKNMYAFSTTTYTGF